MIISSVQAAHRAIHFLPQVTRYHCLIVLIRTPDYWYTSPLHFTRLLPSYRPKHQGLCDCGFPILISACNCALGSSALRQDTREGAAPFTQAAISISPLLFPFCFPFLAPFIIVLPLHYLLVYFYDLPALLAWLTPEGMVQVSS